MLIAFIILNILMDPFTILLRLAFTNVWIMEVEQEGLLFKVGLCVLEMDARSALY